jgi:hypothetical protein
MLMQTEMKNEGIRELTIEEIDLVAGGKGGGQGIGVLVWWALQTFGSGVAKLVDGIVHTIKR